MVPRVGGKGASFKGAALYYLHDKRSEAQRAAGEEVLTTERVAFTLTRNLPTGDPELAWRVMAGTALHADDLKARAGVKPGGRKATEGPVYTYSLAWHTEQAPDKAEMIAAAEASLRHLGYEDHQALLVAHNDEPHPHIHVIVNRVHPVTGRTHNPGNDYRRLSDWAEAYERKHGHIYCEERVLNNERRRAGERVKDENSLPRHLWEQAAARDAKAYTPASLITAAARHHAHFTVEDLTRMAASRTAVKPDELVREALSDPRLVKLYDERGRQAAYTLEATRQQEEATLARAERMAGDFRHGVGDAAMLAAMESRMLDPEQQAAMIHALAPGALKVIEGQAGTGKSHTMAAIVEAAQADGYRVVGLAKTNPVAADMEKTGAFSDARSINSLLWWIENKPEDARARVDQKTMLVIDEAAMVETRLLDSVTKLAEERGAKIVMVGHDRQLSAVEYGGLFTDIAGRVGSAELTTVRRQEEGWQRQASSDMANGRFAEALSAFDERGLLDWQDGLEGSRAALVRQWSRDTAEGQGTRFVFAYTNEEVVRLNAALQDIEIGRGRVRNLQTVQAHDGQLVIGEGDRVAFKGTDKRKNILNGTLGTVEKIDGTRLTVQADAGHRITFDTAGPEGFQAFRLGYAGTIYSGQGKTLDQAYVLHTRHWRDASTYVALTRARADTRMFVAREECLGRSSATPFERLVQQVERQAYRGSSLKFSTAPRVRAAFEAERSDDTARRGFSRAAQDEAARQSPDQAPRLPRRAAPCRPAEEQDNMRRAAIPQERRGPPTQGQSEAARQAERAASIPAHKREQPPQRAPEPERKPLPEGTVGRDNEGRPVYPSPEAKRYPAPGAPDMKPPPDVRTLPADRYAEAVKARQAEDAAAERAGKPPQREDTPRMPERPSAALREAAGGQEQQQETPGQRMVREMKERHARQRKRGLER